jgi:tRNA-2-methylthio-N6-dimethylallyladenosine synthase
MLRNIQSDISISTDIIVGFPGETDEDFIQTMDLIREMEYDSLFAFKYSDRPEVPARHFSGKVSEHEKTIRLQQVLALQEEMTLEKNRALTGSIQHVLVEGMSKKQRAKGKQNFRLNPNRDVTFDQTLTGRIVDVKIKEAYAHSLWGEPVNIEPEKQGLKGDESYAA